MKNASALCLLAASVGVAGCAGQPLPEAPPPVAEVPVAPPTALPAPIGPIWGQPVLLSGACEGAKANIQTIRAEIAKLPPEQVLEAYNRLSLQIWNISGVGELMGAVHPDAAVREAAETCEREIKALANDITLDRGLYDALSAVDASGLDAEAKRMQKKSKQQFELSGVDKDDATRARLRVLFEEMTKTGQTFSRNIREDVRKIQVPPEALAGLPADFVKAHPVGEGGMVTLDTNYPDYFPVLSYAKSEKTRRELTVAFMTRGHPDNAEQLLKLLALRHEYAKLLGYSSWADYNAKDKMVSSAKTIRDFTEQVAKIARPRMQRDLKVLLKRKQKDDKTANKIFSWDRFYYVQKVQQEQYGADSEVARGYFPYVAVRDGLFGLLAELFKVEFKKVDAPVWHPSVEAYELVERAEGPHQGQVVGRFYLDMFPREGKYQHAAMFPMQPGLRDGQIPMASLVCNFPNPADGPALMEHGEVTTFFHEFGHLIHHLLARDSKWANLAGISTEWDFVEAPSQILEEWAWSPKVLQRFAKHHESGEVIPAQLVEKMKKADEFGKGVHVMRQIFFQSLSFYLHDRDPKGLDLVAFTNEMQKKYSPYPYVEGTHVYASFGHLEGYSSVYYTYQWSLALAKDMFTRFEKAGILDPATAWAYREQILGPGGSKPAAELVQTFLGRPYNLDAYKRWLEKD